MTTYSENLGPVIEGQRLQGGGRDSADILNPAAGKAMATLTLATKEDLDRALLAAEKGFARWRIAAPEQRAAVLRATASNIRERTAMIATTITLEQGKPLAEAVAEVEGAASIIDFHAGEAVRAYGRVLMRPAGTRSMVLPQPVGPVAAFCAWNFPALNVVRKIAPAVAAGCSIILKPSEETPASAVEILQCFLDAGLPGDVAQIVFGEPDLVSRHLLASPITRKLSFTGSVPVGKHLMKLAADTVMRMTMELGGHAPVLVFDDCDLDKTLDVLVAHKFRNAGQVCVSPTRFYVQQGIYEAFAQGFADRARGLRMGSGMDTSSQMGPLANDRRPHAISAFVENARATGAKILAGGEQKGESGFFFPPTVISDVPFEARAMQEEPFGPLALMRPFDTLENAITAANKLPFGLAAYCFTENGRRQNILADAVEAGMVAINGVRLSWPDSPFGGVKESGFGSEDGPEGLAAHMVTKAVHLN